MNELKIGRYADVRCDFAFKKCLGTEANKAATIGLLNAIIPDARIADVSFINTELPGRTAEDRKGIIDVLCTDTDGNTFLIEMQRAEHPFFRERTYFYSALYVQNQARRGDWDFGLRPTYVVAFLDFAIRHVTGPDKCVVHYCTREQRSGEKMPGSVEFYFFDLESFTKTEDKLANDVEKWLFLLRNSCRLDSVPLSIKGEAYDVFMDAAEIAGFTKDQYEEYEKDMVTELDMKLALQYAEQKGLKEGEVKGEARGLAKGKKEGKQDALCQTAANLKAMGMSVADIAKATGLSEKEIQRL